MQTEQQRQETARRWQESLQADKDRADYMRRRKQYGDRDGEQQKGRKD